MRYIVYCRKSSEAEDRQVLSISSQVEELKELAERLNLKVVEILTESKSAKEPGRPVFNKMVEMINKGEAEGIICWKLDRLARNPIDGGQIIWMLQKGILKHIQTPERGYYPEDNVLLMSVEFGMANQYILDLSRNVKRGLRAKLEKGWRPNYTPLGYLNDKTKNRGEREIIKDPERFHLVKKIWKLMASGRYQPSKILEIANNKWGLRTRQGTPLSKSSLYSIFRNPFYTGLYEYPRGSGNWYQGKHEPMITQEEFEKVQMILGRRDNPRAQKYDFPFRGLIRCGECGSVITPDEKKQIICSVCKFKFSYKHRSTCPKCGTPIEKMKKPTYLRYLYYYCTKKKNPNCSQSSIEIKELEKQVEEILSKIQISEGFKDWALKYLREENEKEIASRKDIMDNLKRAYDGCLRKLDNLLKLKISPLNSDGSLLSDEEYAKRKAELLKEKVRLEEMMRDYNQRVNKWLDIAEKTFDFACHALYWFKNGTSEEKTQILQALGSNLILRDKKLQIELKKPFYWLAGVQCGLKSENWRFEPEKSAQNEFKLGKSSAQSSILLRGLDSNQD